MTTIWIVRTDDCEDYYFSTEELAKAAQIKIAKEYLKMIDDHTVTLSDAMRDFAFTPKAVEVDSAYV